MHETFDRLRPEILRLGKEEGLWDDSTRLGQASGVPRGDLFHGFWRTLRAGLQPPHPGEF